MKILYNILLIYLAVLLCSFSNCKKGNQNKEPETVCTSANTVLVPQDMKDRFYFKTGTYWIYKNLATNETDSLWVIKDVVENINVDDDDYGYIKNKCYESFFSIIKSNSQQTNTYYNSYAIIIHPKEGKSNSELFGLEDFNLSLNQLAYRIENRGGQYENQMGAEIEFIDSIVIQNIMHRNVMRLKYPVGTSTYDYLDNMYYAKNIGLIKFYRFTDNSSWELIRYHIIQ